MKQKYSFSLCVLWRPLEPRQIWELHCLLLSLLDITRSQTFDEDQCHSSPTFDVFFFGWNKCLIFDQFEECLKLSTQTPTPCSATFISRGLWTAVSRVCQASVSRTEIAADSLHCAKYLPESYAEKRCLDFTTPTYNQTRDFKNPLNDGSMIYIVITTWGWLQQKALSTRATTGHMEHLPS